MTPVRAAAEHSGMTRPRRRFRLPAPLSLLLLSLIAGLGITLAIIAAGVWQRQAFIEQIEAAGGEVYTEPGLPLWLHQQLFDWCGEEFAERFLSIRGVTLHEKTLPMENRRDIIAAIGRQRSISYLALSRTGLDDRDLPLLSDLRETRILGLEGNPLTDESISVIGGMNNLSDLYLHETQVTGSGFGPIGLPALKQIYLNDTPCGDEALRYIGHVAGLQHLVVPGTNVTDAGVAHLGGLADIRRIDLRDTAITDRALPHLARLTTLEELYLSGTQVTDEGLPQLRLLVNLERLLLAGLPVTDAAFDTLEELPSLVYVDLRGTNVTDLGIDRFLRKARPDCEVEHIGEPRRW